MDLTSNAELGTFIATANALARSVGGVYGTVHCKGKEVEQCGTVVARSVLDKLGKVRLAVLGYQPGLVAACGAVLGSQNLRVTDLQPRNIGSERHGVVVLDGAGETPAVLDWADVALVTGSAVANGTLDSILATARECKTNILIFGVTGAAALQERRGCVSSPHEGWSARGGRKTTWGLPPSEIGKLFLGRS